MHNSRIKELLHRIAYRVDTYSLSRERIDHVIETITERPITPLLGGYNAMDVIIIVDEFLNWIDRSNSRSSSD